MTKPSLRPRLEPLESRWVPAGDVTAQVVDGTLYIDGDNAANSIRVVYEAQNHIKIEGLDETTVNGQTSLTINDPDQPFHLVRIDTGNGDDRITFIVAALEAVFTVQTGNGNDDVVIQVMDGLPTPPEVADFRIDTGHGDDHVRFLGSMNLANAARPEIHLGSGDDTIAGDSSGQLWPGIGDVIVRISGGSGQDTLINAAYLAPIPAFVDFSDFESFVV